MADPGVRLQLFIGPSQPTTPAPYEVVEALTEVEVNNNDRQRDGFQLTFALGRSGQAQDYSLLRGGLLDPPNRVCIMVIIRGLPQVLINGIITRHQFIPSNEPGRSQLRVTGEDTGLALDRQGRNETFRNLSDSGIVSQILGNYPDLWPDVTSTQETHSEQRRIVSQQMTDLAFILELARRNGFVFYTEPAPAPGFSWAYWGPRGQVGQLQPPLTMNMGSATNVEQLSFDFNALGPVTPQASIVEPTTGLALPIPVPDSLSPSLSSRPAAALRTTILRDTAGLNSIQAALRLLQAASESAEAVAGNGQLDAVQYGQALRSRQYVGVRGAGQTHDGKYYVSHVTHRLKRGEYKQSFTLSREGRGATEDRV